MKILFVTNSLAVKAGIERTLIDKANYLAAQGHQVGFVTYQQGQHPISYALHPQVTHTDLDCRMFTLYRYAQPWRLWHRWLMQRTFRRRWTRLAARLQPHLVVTTTNSAELMNGIMAVARDYPVVVESHLAYTAQADTSSLLRRWRWSACLRAFRRGRLMIALTEGDAACWRRHLPRVQKVSNPVTWYADELPTVERQPGRIISVGRMNNSQKRFDRLVSAFALLAQRHPQWHIDIYGEGELRPQLEVHVGRLGLQGRVVVHEPVPDVYREYLSSELFVLASDYEGFGLVLVEAMACATPVVSTDCPFGPSEIIDHGTTGLLARMDADDLAEKMEWMITHPEERQTMGLRGRQAAARYRVEQVMKEWERVYLNSARPQT